MFDAYSINSFEECFSQIDVPFGFWCGSADETLNGIPLAEKIREISKISFKVRLVYMEECLIDSAKELTSMV